VIAALLLAAALGAAPPCGLPPLAAGDRPWKTNETLTYELAVLGAVNAGTMQITVERPMPGGIVPLRARAKTTQTAATLKPFTGVALSWIDPVTLTPERYRDEADEGGVHKVSDARIKPARPELVIEHRYGSTAGKTSYPRERDVLDALSTLFYLRAARLTPGERLCWDLVANRRFWRLEATVAAKREKVETPAGKFDTVRVDAITRRADKPDEKPRPIHLWFSTDARHLPVAIVSEVDLGPVSATLSSTRATR
jgi:hypothetical protein